MSTVNSPFTSGAAVVPLTVADALRRAGELRRPQQQRVDAREIDVGQRHLQRVAGPAEGAVGGDLLIAVDEREILHRRPRPAP